MTFRFIHTADWQLGKPFARMSVEAVNALQEARLDAIDAIGRLARSSGAAHVLVAGDVFDAPEPHDRTVRQALMRMGRADCRWWLLPGNHDYARAEGLWGRLARDAPPNVSAVLQAAAVELEPAVWLLPAPLEFRRAEGDPTRVLDMMQTPPGELRLGLAHGPVQDFGGSAVARNLIAADRASRSGLDYLALGDWHGFTRIGERCAYSGAPEPDDFGRAATGGALVVEIAGPGARPDLTHSRTARFDWRQESWSVSDLSGLDAALAGLRRESDLSRTVLRLKVQGVAGLAQRVEMRERLETELALDARWLDLDLEDLLVQPTEDDLGDIDGHGVVNAAAVRLRATIDEAGPASRTAAAALERLFVETLRAGRREGERP